MVRTGLHYVLLLGAVLSVVSAADLQSVRRGPVPSWVRETPWSVPDGPAPSGAAAQVLLSDSQDRLAPGGGEYYNHFVIRLLTADAVSRYAQIKREVAPEFETVTWHALRLHRGTTISDRLSTVDFKPLQRELALEAQMLTGTTTYAAVLDDVAEGDVLEMTYTLSVNNPLFHEALNSSHLLGGVYPTVHQRVSVTLPTGGPECRDYFTVPEGTNGLPEVLYRQSELRLALTESKSAVGREICWDGHDIPAVEFERQVPASARPYLPEFRVSSFKTWADVVEWADPLFAQNEPVPESLTPLLAEWRKHDEGARILDAVLWVQNEVRYFALELGQNTMKPRALRDVCSSRYGDCKDKSALLVRLLRELGIEAWPALVSTYWRGTLLPRRPDPFAFNHVIVAYRSGGELRWVDPTLKKQGAPGRWALPAYGAALLIRAKEADLTRITATAGVDPDVFAIDRIKVDEATGDAIMDCELTLRGIHADMYRQSSASVSSSERSKSWFNFVGRFYRTIEEQTPPAVTDNVLENRVTIVARYRMPRFARKSDEGTTVSVYGYALRTFLDMPESRRRRWPYALPQDPTFVRHRIEVEAPFDLALQEQPELIRADGMEYRMERATAGKKLIVQHDLRFMADSVPPEAMGRFIDAVEEIFQCMSTSLRRSSAPPNAQKASGPS